MCLWPALLLLFASPSVPLWSQQPSLRSHSAATVSTVNSEEPSSSGASTSPANLAVIHGTVAAADGALYEGARVTLQTSGVPATEVQSTDDSGQFTFQSVAPGPFKLTVSADGFESATLAGTVTPGEDFDAHSIALAFASSISAVEVRASRYDVAQEQLRIEEQQRVLGIVPNFFVAYSHDAVPLSRGQKFHLSWRSSIDPLTILSSGITAGIEQANNNLKEYGQGTAGFAKRFGASYGDNVIGTFIGSAIMPSLLHQDPRYFYRGTGTVRSRIFYAIANSVVCKSDSGRWQPNYSNFIGDFASAGISTLYYPPSARGSVGLIFQNFAIAKVTSAGQNILQEFVIPRFTVHKHPAF